MAGTRTGYVVIGVLLASGAAAWWWQQQATALLRVQADARRAEDRDLARVRAEHRRLAAAQVSAQELEDLRADRAALTRMRAEIDALKRAIEKEATAPAPAMPVAPAKIPASEWKNAGRGTPAAAVETVMWAAAGGDVDALAATLSFDPKTRPMIEAFFGALPPAMQQQYGTPERLVAFFTAKDIPLGTMQIVGQQAAGPDDTIVAVLLQDPEGRPKKTQLAVRRGDDGWRLLVPMAAVQNYANTIGAALAPGPR